MELFEDIELPFQPVISFESVIKDLEDHVAAEPGDRQAKKLLAEVNKIPELRTGFSDVTLIKENEPLIHELLAPLFPSKLSPNEIKAATIPLSNFIFNPTERFQKILSDAGEEFKVADIRFENQSFYIVCCNIILRSQYRYANEGSSPLFYSMRNKQGIKKHYRILYNADLIELIPKETALELSRDEISILLENFDNEALWKEKFPPNSWIIKGFGLITLYDATIETAMSELKHYLFNRSALEPEIEERRRDLFKSIFNISYIDIGLSRFSASTKEIVPSRFNHFVKSFFLGENNDMIKSLDCSESSFYDYAKEGKIYIISDVDAHLVRHPKDVVAQQLKKKNAKSCMLIPLIRRRRYIATMELVSNRVFAFNSITSHKVESLREILTDSLENAEFELSNYTDALIQKEYTSIHESVVWKFEQEAENFLKSRDEDYRFNDIVFNGVYALYGETDIRGSSVLRNNCVRSDLSHQLKLLLAALKEMKGKHEIKKIDKRFRRLRDFLWDVQNNFEADTEQETQQYIFKKIHTAFESMDYVPEKGTKLREYLESLDPNSGLYYKERRKFDEAITGSNRMFAKILDKRQKEVQKVFPHYFDRFSTDGVEHNMYIGASIAQNQQFRPYYLHNLRFWQVQVICESTIAYQKKRKELPIPLEITSLILAFNKPISILFRTDGKRFDVDGAYNASYEIIKKRIDKACVLGTDERITQVNQLTVVYLQNKEEREYLGYFQFLRTQGIVLGEIEILQVEKLQGITGLKAIRASVNIDYQATKYPYFSYSEISAE